MITDYKKLRLGIISQEELHIEIKLVRSLNFLYLLWWSSDGVSFTRSSLSKCKCSTGIAANTLFMRYFMSLLESIDHATLD